MKITTRIKRWRKREGLTYFQAAVKLGVMPSTVRRWELGETKPVGVFVEKLDKVVPA